MTENYKNILSESLHSMVKLFIENQEPFILLIQNHNNWDKALPDSLKEHEKFILDFKEQTLEDSYVEDGEIILNTVFGEDDYTKVLHPYDIAAIMTLDMKSPLFFKPFVENPPIELKEDKEGRRIYSEPNEDELRTSMDAFKKNNPELFEV